MIAVIGKTLLYTLTAMGVISVGYTLFHPPVTKRRLEHISADSSTLIRGCVHIQFAETPDSTYWESQCKKPNVPYDTVIVRYDP